MEFRDLKKQYQQLKPQMDAAIQQVLHDANFISGKQVAQLEEKLAEYVGVKHCITCGNGTDALSLVMMAWDIKEGDAVFVPDFTFFASAEVVSFEGATPVFVDVDERTFNLDPDQLEKAIAVVKQQGKLRPRAVVAVDLFGQPADYERIEAICKEHGLLLLEDGAQGFGGSIGERRACSFGDAATTSFSQRNPWAAMATAEQCSPTTTSSTSCCARCGYMEKARSASMIMFASGVNSRLDTLQAAVLGVKLDAFASYELEAVNRAAQMYSEYLGEATKTPVVPEGFGSSWAQYTILLKDEAQRQKVQHALKEQGIPTMVYYPKPMHLQGAFDQLEQPVACPVTESLCQRVVSLPMHPYLSEEDIRFVSNAVKAALEE